MSKLEYTHSDIVDVEYTARVGECNRIMQAIRHRLDELEDDPTVETDPELRGYRNGLRAALHVANVKHDRY